MTITEFLLARIQEDEAVARDLLSDLEDEVSEDWADQSDEHGPMTPDRLLSAQMWSHYDGQSKRRSFARGHQIATLASPTRVLAECAAKRAIVEGHDFIPENDPHAWNGMSDIAFGNYEEWIEILKILAAAYEAHIDYRGEWKP